MKKKIGQQSVYYNNSEFPYLYETHLHTKTGSACGHSTGREMVYALKEAGYQGMFITDHFYYGNTAVKRHLSWKDWVEQFSLAYREAKELGDQLDFQVFFGWESGYRGTEFLIYGMSPEWLLLHPEIKDATIQEQYDLIHKAGGMVIQAHPFRKEFYIPKIRLYPESVDGAEVSNSAHTNLRNPSHYDTEADIKALQYAKEHDLCMTGGSDIHSAYVYGGGMAFSSKLHSAKDFMERVLGREEVLILNGNEKYFLEIDR